MFLIDFVIDGVQALFFLWMFFVSAIKLQEKVQDKSKTIQWAFKIFIGLPFIIFDFLFNIVYGTVIYVRLPDFKGARFHVPLFTHRLRESLINDPVDSWRFELSHFICAYMVEPYDWGHCKLQDLRDKIKSKK